MLMSHRLECKVDLPLVVLKQRIGCENMVTLQMAAISSDVTCLAVSRLSDVIMDTKIFVLLLLNYQLV